jgi:cobyrinic acid a,c-diamide synthase
MKSLCIAAVSSGTGKTTVTLGLIAALQKIGLQVQAFKCGPDYIDPEYHRVLTNKPSHNLDSFLMPESEIKNIFHNYSTTADISIIEGVMGLFDGSNSNNITGSTAHISAITNTPILLVINARGMARSIAPLVSGFVNFNKNIKIIGVIANNVGSTNHAKILREALETSNLPPLIGYLERDNSIKIEERHLGLITAIENNDDFREFSNNLSKQILKNFDIQQLLSILPSHEHTEKIDKHHPTNGLKVSIAYDKAFNFYYQYNLDLLLENGFEIEYFSPINDDAIPNDTNLLLIGGGFPELYAKELSKNNSMIESIKQYHNENGCIYAECGGMMYLSRSLIDRDTEYPMCNIFPFKTRMNSKLRQLGYREIEITSDSIFGTHSTKLRGHEFHWSEIIDDTSSIDKWCSSYSPRNTQKNTADGFKIKNTFASYLHIHFANNKDILQNIKKHIGG